MKHKGISGYLQAMSAYFLWGFTPLYWHHIGHIASLHLLYHRVFWGFVFAWLCMLLFRQRTILSGTLLRREAGRIAAGGVLLAVNWLVYITAVNSGYLQDASLGYYINPLVSIFLGMAVLGERLNRLEKTALLLVIVGVLVLTIQLGRFPWISFVLAFSFGTYGLIKKKSALSSLASQTLEMSFILPVLSLGLVFLDGTLQGLFAEALRFSAGTMGFLSLSGPITVIPLILFSLGAQRINLSAIGFLQFIAPTMMLIISVAVFREPFPIGNLPGFLLVWSALVLYAVSRVRAQRLSAV